MKTIVFDYSRLTGKIIEVYGSKTAFSKAMDWSPTTLTSKLLNRRYWNQADIIRASELLRINIEDIPIYFLTVKVVKS